MRTIVCRVVTVLTTVTWITASVFAQNWDQAVSLYNQKQYRQAIREFHGLLKANPEYWSSWFYIGSSHFELKSYEDAVDAFTNYIKGAEKDEKAQSTGHYYVGFSQFQLKQYDKTIAAFTAYIALSEKNQQKIDPNARAALGRAYIFTNRYAEAIPVLTAAAAEMRTNANNHYYIGYANHKLGKPDKAILSLNQALTIDPKDADSLSLLANIYLAQTKTNPAALKQAIATAEKLATVKNDDQSWLLLGQVYLADKQFTKASPVLEKYARAHPDQGPAWFNLGLALSRSEQWKPAADALEKAVKLTPSNVAALLEMGYVYESDKQYDKALSAYERAFDASGKKDQTAKDGIDRIKQARS